MKGSLRDSGAPNVSSSAPLPQLGYAIDSAAHAQERRTRTLSRVALGIAIASVLLCIALIGGLFWETSRPEAGSRHRSSDVILGLMLFLCPLCMLLGLLLGGITRKTRTGKAAMLVSLTPLGIAVIAFVVTIIVAFFIGVARGLKN